MRPCTVRIDVTLPNHELSVDRVHDVDVYIALRRGAFDDMKRQAEDAVRRTRGQVRRVRVPRAQRRSTCTSEKSANGRW